MRSYIIRRILQMIPVFLGILFILFFIFSKVPGGPINMYQNPKLTPEQRAIIAERMDPSMPFYQKFFNWLTEAAKGNFGYSIRLRKPVTAVVGSFVVPTVRLALASLIFSLLVGIPIGVISATKKGTLLDNSLTVFSLCGISMPTFFFGLLLLKVFSVELRLFPLYGMQNRMLKDASTLTVWLNIAWHTVLPTIVLGLSSTATFMRYTRSSMLEVIRQDYIRTARAKGLKEKVVIYRHAFRNAVLPIVTLLGFWIPNLVSGAVMTETIFAYPGLGKVIVDSVNTRDYPIMIGITSMLAILTLFAALIADILYAVADPRIKFE